MKIKQLRTKVLKLGTQANFAKSVGISPQLVSHLEHNRRALRYDLAIKLQKLAKKSGKTLDLGKLMKANRKSERYTL